jgi:chromosomal replication initiator protein
VKIRESDRLGVNMMNTVKEKWPEIIEHLRVEHELSNVSFNTWIQPLKVYDVVDNTVFILVNMNASVEYIEKKYQLPLKVCIAEITGTEYEVVFISEDDDRLNEIQNMAIEANQKKKSKSAAEKAGLNPKYTFDTFVVGGNNNFAHAASLAVAESPGEVYNPLFLYGGVGLGKTHLMHSVAHYILEHDPSKKVLYVTSETFTNELIDALKVGKNGNELAMTTFREKYRNNDVLLIDDIQFIIGKESTQEEFFHTFNHLHVSGKQIIISSDKPPKDIETLEARLRTRFEWGLIADISSPDYETRMAILRKKEELDGLEKYHIPDEVMQYIANNIKSNIRELEGSLNKLIALSNLENKPIDIPLAAEALKDMISPDDTRAVSPELIMDVVSEHFNVPVAELKGKKRNAEIVLPRQIVMYLCRNMTDTPLKSIGALLGGKDHASISHGVRKIENDLKTDEALNNTVNIIKKKINPV